VGKLCEMTMEDVNPELTGSLARSFKDGLILPAERKFSRLEKEITSLKEHIDTESLKKEQRLDEYVNHINNEMSILKKMFRLGNYMSLLSLAGIITLMAVLFFWY